MLRAGRGSGRSSGPRSSPSAAGAAPALVANDEFPVGVFPRRKFHRRLDHGGISSWERERGAASPAAPGCEAGCPESRRGARRAPGAALGWRGTGRVPGCSAPEAGGRHGGGLLTPSASWWKPVKSRFQEVCGAAQPRLGSLFHITILSMKKC